MDIFPKNMEYHGEQLAKTDIYVCEPDGGVDASSFENCWVALGDRGYHWAMEFNIILHLNNKTRKREPTRK